MEAAGSFVNQKLNTAIPWTDLVASSNLQKVLHAIVQRLDRHDKALAGKGGGVDNIQGNLTVISDEDMRLMRNRLEILENTTLQNRVEKLSPLQNVAAKSQAGFNLGQHVIPLMQMKKRIESCEVGLLANASAVDATQRLVADTAAALHTELEEAVAKLATKEELRAVEKKHDDFVVKAEKRMDQLRKDIDRLAPRVDRNEASITALLAEMEGIRDRLGPLEDEMPLKATKEQLDVAIKEIWDELEKINIEESECGGARRVVVRFPAPLATFPLTQFRCLWTSSPATHLRPPLAFSPLAGVLLQSWKWSVRPTSALTSWTSDATRWRTHTAS